MKIRLKNCSAIALVLLLLVKAGISFYVIDKPTWAFPVQDTSYPFFPSPDEDTLTVYSILPNISLPVSERNIQHNHNEIHNKYDAAGIHFASVQLHLRTCEYIRYSLGIKPSLESTRLIYPFHTYL